MGLFFGLLTVLGLTLFEVITSIDNAIINAQVLATMKERARRFFLTWGILFAVFIIRGLLPWLIVWFAIPELGPIGALTAAFSQDPRVLETIERSAPVLLTGGGIFLIFLFLDWLFLEKKEYGLTVERFFHSQQAWFFALISVLLTAVIVLAVGYNPALAVSAAVGSTTFFIVHGFREYAEQGEVKMIKQNSGGLDISKIVYLEAIDASFSIDGVIGAFAFTFSVPLILVGNGIGALMLRQLTVSNIERIKKYRYLKNGAMYSILFLGVIMLLDAFGMHVPPWVSPLVTFVTVGYFFQKSRSELVKQP